MLMLLQSLDRATYTPRLYVAAETDAMSARRALAREATWAGSEVRWHMSVHFYASAPSR
jgi:hypothetical protein